MAGPTKAAVQEPTTLMSGAVALWGDFVAALTNVAPSCAIALTLGAIVSYVGLAGPSVMLMVGIAMLCIAIAYDRLNFWAPSAAAQAHWVARAIRPIIGLGLGIMIMIESVVSNIANTTLFGPYLLGIIMPDQAGNGLFQFIVSALMTVVVLVIAIAGVKAAIRFQSYILWVEYAIMLGFGIILLQAELSGHPGSQVPSLAWLLPTEAPDAGSFVTAIALAVFAFGGWENAVYLAEEQKDAKRHPGRAGILTVIVCTVWFCFMFMVIQGIAPKEELVAHSANVVAFAAQQVMPSPWHEIVSLAVLSSVLAVVQSQFQVFSRMGFGLARDGLLPKALARLSQSRTPWIGLIVAAIFPVVLLGVYLANSSAAQVLSYVSGTAGILYLVMYVVAAIACMWYFRRTLSRGGRHLFYAGILPAIGVIILLVALVAAIPITNPATLIPAAIFVFVGIPIAYWVKSTTHNKFFDQKPTVASPDDWGPGAVASDDSTR
jgi:amino acid transporter